jgi:hypothetical protein
MLQERCELETSLIKTARDLQENGDNHWGVGGEFSRGVFLQEQEWLFTHLDGTKCVTSSTFMHVCRRNWIRLISCGLSVLFIQNASSERLMEGHVLCCGKILFGRYPLSEKKC